MECKKSRANDKRTRRWKKSFTEALKEKYCVEDEQTFDFIIVSPKRKSDTAELAHLQTVVLNEMNVTRADIPHQGLSSLCPNVVDLDLANNLLEKWSELLDILSHLPRVKFVNVSLNKLRLDPNDTLPDAKLSVENLALNYTGVTIEEIVRLSKLMPGLKELHLCGNSYSDLSTIEQSIKDGAFSSLECLRLNNNEISKWSEVWKVRHLPHLKFLILSGNPISNVFYEQDDAVVKFSTEIEIPVETPNNIEPDGVIQTSEKLSSSAQLDRDDIFESVENQGEIDDLSSMNINDEYDQVLPDNLHNSDGEDELDLSDGDDDDYDGRPVSRFGHYSRSDCSRSSCASGRNSLDSESEGAQSIEGEDSLNMSPSLEDNSFSNSNINNSHKRERNRAAFGNGEFNTLGFLGPEGDAFLDSESLTGDNTDDETEDWHRIAAETFLYDLINSINFDEEPPRSSHSFTQPSVAHSDASTATAITTENSYNASFQKSDIECGIETVVTNQTHQEEIGTDEAEMGNANILAKLLEGEPDDCPIVGSFANGDADFVPRAVMIFDEPDLMLPQPSRTMASVRRSAQRCLFPESELNSNNNNNDTLDETNTASASGQSASEACSDCESEQHHRKDIMNGMEFSVLPRMSSSNVMSCLSDTSPVHSPAKTDNSSHTVPQSVMFRIANGNLSLDLRCSDRGTTMSHSDTDENKLLNVDHSLNQNDHQDSSHHHHHHHHHHYHHHHQAYPHEVSHDAQDSNSEPKPFQHLQMLCLSSANLNHWSHLKAFSSFPKLTNLKLKNNPLYSHVHPDDRRKLYIASLPKACILNGSEVSQTEREKAERFYLRHFMDKEEKPEFYHTLVKKHGPPVKLVDIDLSAGYQEWAELKFVCKGVVKFTRKIHLVEPVGKLRLLISRALDIPKWCFTMYHHLCGPSHPESERELIELRCESLPMSRFDFADGDEIHVDVQG